MNKALKIVLIVFSVSIALILGTCLLISAFWNGTFNFLDPKEIATYNSPDGEYSLVFEQLGEPRGLFGPTDVRLTLKNRDGKTVGRAEAQVFDDGANAHERTVASVSWNEYGVAVVLRASEMEDKEISIPYGED